jgi:hypothetical protein
MLETSGGTLTGPGVQAKKIKGAEAKSKIRCLRSWKRLGVFVAGFICLPPVMYYFSLVSISGFLKNDNRLQAENILSPQFCFI